MSNISARISLINGTGSIPVVGLGSYLSKPKEVENAVEHAVRVGYRHFDASYNYDNQEEIGAALKKVVPSVVKREELFIVSKLENYYSHHPEDVEPELDITLKQLGLDYIDLYLIHWPVAFLQNDAKPPQIDFSVTIVETWRAVHKLLATGKVKNIGVSNFTIGHLKKLIAVTGIKPAVNQIELHPYLLQKNVLEYAKREGIILTAFFPFGGDSSITHANLLDHPVIKKVAANYPGATPAQVLINWGISRGYTIIPKSVTPERIKSNLVELKLRPEDLEKVSRLAINNQKRFALPAVTQNWPIDIFGTPEEKGLPTFPIA